ncbi:MAG: hypothetical protein JXB88_16625 [Spirochaetales bacterium]|nr:hypothetical protein [Spirochaetales bacterium]
MIWKLFRNEKEIKFCNGIKSGVYRIYCLVDMRLRKISVFISELLPTGSDCGAA